MEYELYEGAFSGRWVSELSDGRYVVLDLNDNGEFWQGTADTVDEDVQSYAFTGKWSFITENRLTYQEKSVWFYHVYLSVTDPDDIPDRIMQVRSDGTLCWIGMFPPWCFKSEREYW